MILAFSLLGKFMGSGLDDKPSQVMPLPILKIIDFGSIKLVNHKQQWRSEYSSTPPVVSQQSKQNGPPQEITQQDLRYSEIASQWQQLLDQPAKNATSPDNTVVKATYFVQLHFEGNDQALVVRVESITNKSVTAKNSKQTIITFVNSNLQLVKPGPFTENILPAALLEKN